jgi:hypothetical protein
MMIPGYQHVHVTNLLAECCCGSWSQQAPVCAAALHTHALYHCGADQLCRSPHMCRTLLCSTMTSPSSSASGCRAAAAHSTLSIITDV